MKKINFLGNLLIMARKKGKLTIGILFMILLLLLAIVAGQTIFNHEGTLTKGEKTILLCAVDQTEPREGMGAIDMAYLVTLQDGSVKNFTPVYPHGMRHPTEPEPEDALDTGARNNAGNLLLHDALWYADKNQGIKFVKEIVEYNLSIKLDAIVLANVEAVDALVKAAGPLSINGTPVVVDVLEFVREDQEDGASRGTSVMTVMQGMAIAAHEPDTRNQIMKMAIIQYNKGNIVVWPEEAFMQLLYTKGINAILN